MCGWRNGWEERNEADSIRLAHPLFVNMAEYLLSSSFLIKCISLASPPASHTPLHLRAQVIGGCWEGLKPIGGGEVCVWVEKICLGNMNKV